MKGVPYKQASHYADGVYGPDDLAAIWNACVNAHKTLAPPRPEAVDPDAYSIIDGMVQCANIGRFDGKLMRAAQDWMAQADARRDTHQKASAPVGVDELVREYRPSMDAEVLHAWAKDIVGALAQPPASVIEATVDRAVAAYAAGPWAAFSPEASREAHRERMRAALTAQQPAPAAPMGVEGQYEEVTTGVAYIHFDNEDAPDWNGQKVRVSLAQQTASDPYRVFFERAMDTAHEAMEYVQNHAEQFGACPGDDKLAIVCREFLKAQQPAVVDEATERDARYWRTLMSNCKHDHIWYHVLPTDLTEKYDSIEEVLDALAAQPGADPRSTHRVWRGEWQPCYCGATDDHLLGREQPGDSDNDR